MTPKQPVKGPTSSGQSNTRTSRAIGSDLAVKLVSEALAGIRLDVIVSGSIGAVESVRFIRALRRLGAEITPWLTKGGSQFVTPVAVGWAAARECRTGFEADASHLAENHGCIIAPASASFIAKVATGMTETPAAALVTSYLGQQLPVMVLPSMHDSLAHAPQVQGNLKNLQSANATVTILGSRLEEGKHKVPEPAILADHCAHAYNAAQFSPGIRERKILITLGGTRSRIDDVRFVGNYSSGKLGSLIAEELYRLGHNVDVVAGPAEVLPQVFSSLTRVTTNDELEAACAGILKKSPADIVQGAIVHAAAVLDFQVVNKSDGKIPSSAGTQTITLTPTRKILDSMNTPLMAKVAFKLETGATIEAATDIAKRYIAKHQLSMLVVNNLENVGIDKHKAWIFEAGKSVDRPYEVNSKQDVALTVARHISDRIVHHD